MEVAEMCTGNRVGRRFRSTKDNNRNQINLLSENSCSRSKGRSVGPKQLGCPVSFPHHLLSVSSPSALVAVSNCPMTSDSRSCRGSSSTSFQNPRSIVHRPLPLPCSLLLAYTLPRPPI